MKNNRSYIETWKMTFHHNKMSTTNSSHSYK
ncbi:hypothetical protein Nmel_005639 [Mimus melanotis]